MKHACVLGTVAVVVVLATTSLCLATQATGTAVPAPQAPADNGPLYRDYRGVSLGMTADAVRDVLGKPKQAGKAADYFEFSNKLRARVYYDAERKAEAVVATYIGADSEPPTPEAVLGVPIKLGKDGSGSRKVDYPAQGYWVAYSRTGGKQPMVIITMKKL